MKDIKVKMKETEDDLKDLGPEICGGQTEMQQMLWNMVTDFIQTYKNTISGKFDSKRQMSSSGKGDLSGGAKIKMNFYNLYQEYSGYKATSEYNDMHIQKAI